MEKKEAGRAVKSIAARFQATLEDVNPTDSERGTAVEFHIRIRDTLIAESFIEETFLTGSYKRKTATKPLNDVDIFVVLSESWQERTIDEIVKKIAHTLGSIENIKIRKQRHSIGLEFKETEITFDVIPAFIKTHEIYKIPKGIMEGSEGWISTNPKAAQEKLKLANIRCESLLLPLIKLLKHWNQTQPKRPGTLGKDKKPFKSFHLEVMCYDVSFLHCENLRTQMAKLLTHVYEKFNVDRSLPAPGIGAPPLSSYIDSGEHPFSRDELTNMLRKAEQTAQKACEAEKNGHTETAHRQWSSLFPAYKMTI